MVAPQETRQLDILQRLQRLLSDGSFTASYKYALLQALADISVERCVDSDIPLRIAIEEIAEKLIAYYWRQAAPYVGGGPARIESTASTHVVAHDGPVWYHSHPPSVLRQNTGKQAEVVELLVARYAQHHGSLASLRADGGQWVKLCRRVARKIVQMPLFRLQRIGRSSDLFLYDPGEEGTVQSIELRPGVGFTFARFHGLVLEVVRGHWLQFVRGLPANRRILGETEDLHEFLFGSERAGLGPYRDILGDLQRRSCFYCESDLRGRGAVDHFIAWSRYPLDLAHNFVLAHDTCNASKGNRLASARHLERWARRNIDQAADLNAAFDERGLLHDLSASRAVARWAYMWAERMGSRVWHSRSEPEVDLDAAWRALGQL